LQARECVFRLASGRKCRAAANRHQPFCRHHAPKPAVPAPPSIPKSERYSNLSRWRRIGIRLDSIPVEEIPREIWDILQCLVDRGPDSTGRISNLTAGRFLRALLNRLGDVPFPDPDLALESEDPTAPAPCPGTSSAAPGLSAPPSPRTSAKDYRGLFAALGLPPQQAAWLQTRPQSHTSVNQSRTRVNQ
jgi:hypothetical protein